MKTDSPSPGSINCQWLHSRGNRKDREGGSLSSHGGTLVRMCTHTHMLLTYRTSSCPDCSSVELDTIVAIMYPRKYHSIFSLVTLEDTLRFLSFLLSLSCPHFKREQNKRRLDHADLRKRKCKIQELCLLLSGKLDWLLKLSWEQGKCHRRGRSMVE